MEPDDIYRRPDEYGVVLDPRSDTYVVTRGADLLGHAGSKELAYYLISNSRTNRTHPVVEEHPEVDPGADHCARD